MCLSPLYMYQTKSEYEENATSEFVRPFTEKGHKYTADFLRTRKRRYTFNPKRALDSTKPIPVPCGKCAECRKKARQDWSTRIQNEASMHDENAFITLTYNNACLPLNDEGKPTLRYVDVQLFLKRLRKAIFERYGKKIRFYCVGEYGTKFSRPHYHLIIFGHGFFETRKPIRKRGNFLDYIDEIVGDCWKYGYHTVNDYTPSSANYVSGYVTKKLTSDKIYDGIEPEFHRMSRRDGIGKKFMLTHMKEVFNEHGFRIRGNNGYTLRSIPRRYLAWLKDINTTLHSQVIARLTAFALSKVERTLEECRSAQAFLENAFKNEKRTFEDGTTVLLS